ncbi:trans-sialidase-like protein [Trypanosoma cruzi]|nr:trans-sialidase-like protein [Trypanosoma cruzi]
MLSRVAAVKAPNKHNRRRVTGSSGRRRKARESEHRRPNMSRHVFTSAVLLLFVLLMCCSGATAAQVGSNADASTSGSALTDAIAGEGSASGGVEELQRVDLFVPRTTQVLPKKGTTGSSWRDSFVSPSLVSAGGVIAAFAEGHINAKKKHTESTKPSFDVVAEYIDSAWEWPTLVEKVKKEEWSAHTVLGASEGKGSLDVVYRPTTTKKGNKVFLLVGSSNLSYVNGKEWKRGSLELKLVVGEVTNPTGSEQNKRIKWGEIKSPLNQTTLAAHKGELKEFVASGGSGILMEDGTLVFPLMAKSGNGDVYSMIICSTNNGRTWALPEETSHPKCFNPRITEWDGSLLMIVDCENGQRVYESRDMGTKWTEAIGTLPGVWTKSQSEDYPDGGLHVDALITATIEGRKVMLYTQRGNFSGKNKANPLYLLVTDNNRTFCVGPVAVEEAAVRWEFASNLLYSDGKLHLLQRRGDYESSVISLSRLTEELSTIKSVLSTWSQTDAFFSSFSIPTAGLVAVLSDAASNGTWIDEYLCLNAAVTNATKVKDGFQLTESNSGVLWFVNTRDDNVRHVSLSHNFTLVASVTIEDVPSNNTPLLGAMLANTNSTHTMGILYTADKKWETMFQYDEKTTTESRPWEPKKEYQVALMLQGNKSSMYVDGQSLGEEELPLKGEAPLDLVSFCFGACDMQNSPMTVTNVFLYNRPLNPTEMAAIKDRKPVPKRVPEPQAGDVPQTIASAVSGPKKNSAPGRTTVERAANTQNAPAGRLTSAGNEGTARETGDGGANGDAGSAYGRGLLPLLLLLGLCGFAAA